MSDLSVLGNNAYLVELNKQFSLDELDDWHTTTGLAESAVALISARFPGLDPHIFIHVSEAREYREIDREGISSIPEDSLFIACLAMHNEGANLSDFFSQYAIQEPLLQELLQNAYGAAYVVPIVHRFSMLGFILVGQGNAGPGEPSRDENAEDLKFLAELTSRLRINLYAASIADERQRQLLKLSEYPKKLRQRKSVVDLSRHILDDLAAELEFDFGVYYENDEFNQRLVPVVWQGEGELPVPLREGKGISGLTLERRHTLYAPDRNSHPAFSLIRDEPWVAGSFISAPISMAKRTIGVVTLCRYAGSKNSFGVEHRYTLEILAAYIAADINNRLLYDELEQSYFSTVSSLAKALDAKDHYTLGHSERVMKYAVGTAMTLGLAEDTVRRIRYAAILHDIGKIGISDSIISKPDKLTDEEFAQIRKHTEIGYDIVTETGFFGEIRDLIRYHHEKMDGTGYYAMRQGQYPWEAMIISLADIFDALSSDRPYRAAFSREKTLAMLGDLVGLHFDKRIFEAFRIWIYSHPESFPQKKPGEAGALARKTGSAVSSSDGRPPISPEQNP